jgi:hypothetical protein
MFKSGRLQGLERLLLDLLGTSTSCTVNVVAFSHHEKDDYCVDQYGDRTVSTLLPLPSGRTSH